MYIAYNHINNTRRLSMYIKESDRDETNDLPFQNERISLPKFQKHFTIFNLQVTQNDNNYTHFLTIRNLK